MLGLMQDWPLLCHRIIDHAARQPRASARSCRARLKGRSTAPITPSARARAACGPARSSATASGSATASRRLPGTPGAIWKPGTASSGIGAIYHTVNPRLFPEQIAWIVNHAEDRVMLFDMTFMPLVEKLAAKLPTDRALCRADRRRAHAGRPRCATRSPTRNGSPRSTTTSPGRRSTRTPPPACATPPAPPAIPKGVLYSHRSNVLHGLMAATARHAWVSRRATWSCRSCRCSTPIAGRWPSPRRWSGAALVMPGAEARRRVDLRTARRYNGHLHRRRADGLAHAAAASRADRQASCRTSSESSSAALPVRAR